MSSLSFGRWVSVESVPRQGITALSTDDIALAARLGFVIKLVARAQYDEEAGEPVLRLGVEPTFVPLDHAFASLHGPANGVFVNAQAAGTLSFLGLGAGGFPTASAVLGDIVAAARDRLSGLGAMREEDELPVRLSENWSVVSPFIIRLSIPTTSGISESVSRVCSSHEVSLQGIDIEAGDTEGESVVTLTTQAIARDRAHGLVEALVHELSAHVPPAIFPLLDI